MGDFYILTMTAFFIIESQSNPRFQVGMENNHAKKGKYSVPLLI